MKRLIGAIIQGIGWSAGQDIYEGGKEKVRQALDRLPDADAKTPKRLTKQARAVEGEIASAARKRERTVDAQLAALKRKMGL